jgi:hypothetical protein
VGDGQEFPPKATPIRTPRPQTPDEMIFEMVRSPQDRSFGGRVLLSDVERQKWPRDVDVIRGHRPSRASCSCRMPGSPGSTCRRNSASTPGRPVGLYDLVAIGSANGYRTASPIN